MRKSLLGIMLATASFGVSAAGWTCTNWNSGSYNYTLCCNREGNCHMDVQFNLFPDP